MVVAVVILFLQHKAWLYVLNLIRQGKMYGEVYLAKVCLLFLCLKGERTKSEMLGVCRERDWKQVALKKGANGQREGRGRKCVLSCERVVFKKSFNHLFMKSRFWRLWTIQTWSIWSRLGIRANRPQNGREREHRSYMVFELASTIPIWFPCTSPNTPSTFLQDRSRLHAARCVIFFFFSFFLPAEFFC